MVRHWVWRIGLLLQAGMCTALYSTALYSTALYSTGLYSAGLYKTALCSTAMIRTVLYSTTMHSAAMFSIAIVLLFCITLLHEFLAQTKNRSLYIPITSVHCSAPFHQQFILARYWNLHWLAEGGQWSAPPTAGVQHIELSIEHFFSHQSVAIIIFWVQSFLQFLRYYGHC